MSKYILISAYCYIPKRIWQCFLFSAFINSDATKSIMIHRDVTFVQNIWDTNSI